MIDNGKISIIVPMYNCAEFAPKCIENILSQSYTNWELWLVHGDSKDGTETVCQKYEDKDERIKNIFHIDGLVPARNVGYERATGNWIMYIDGDDWIDGDCLVEIMETAQRYNNPDVIFWKCVQELEHTTIKGKWEWKCEDEEHLYTGEECRMLSQNTLEYKSGIATAYAKIMRADFCRKNNLEHNRNLRQGMEGMEFCMRVFYYAVSALYMNKYYNHYRYNPNSLSKIVSKKNAEYIYESAEECDKFIDTIEKDWREKFRSSLYKRSLYAIIAAALSTFFHPNNHDSFSQKKREFKELCNKGVFAKAVSHGDISQFDKSRKIVVTAIRRGQYWLLPLVTKAKLFLLKRGYYNY